MWPRDAASGRPVLGVLGGMGPAATSDFFQKLIELTPAKQDQDHIPTLICSYPQIPDRSEAILNKGPTPVPAMLRALHTLEICGVSRVAIPCNTAHYWFDELQSRTSLPIVHIVDAVAHALRGNGLRGGVVGLLATTGTVKALVYPERLKEWKFRCLVPDDSDQHRLMNVIRAVKSGRIDGVSKQLVAKTVRHLFERGAQSVILGCTEFPLLRLQQTGLLDSTEALARACLSVEPIKSTR